MFHCAVYAKYQIHIQCVCVCVVNILCTPFGISSLEIRFQPNRWSPFNLLWRCFRRSYFFIHNAHTTINKSICIHRMLCVNFDKASSFISGVEDKFQSVHRKVCVINCVSIKFREVLLCSIDHNSISMMMMMMMVILKSSSITFV